MNRIIAPWPRSIGKAIAERLNREDDVPWVTVGKALESSLALLEQHPTKQDKILKFVANLKHIGSEKMSFSFMSKDDRLSNTAIKKGLELK